MLFQYLKYLNYYGLQRPRNQNQTADPILQAAIINPNSRQKINNKNPSKVPSLPQPTRINHNTIKRRYDIHN